MVSHDAEVKFPLRLPVVGRIEMKYGSNSVTAKHISYRDECSVMGSESKYQTHQIHLECRFQATQLANLEQTV